MGSLCQPCDRCLFELGCDKSRNVSWCEYLRSRWCILLYIILAFIGILPVAVQANADCVYTMTQRAFTGPQPVDVFVGMDASRSLSVTEWILQQGAVTTLFESFIMRTGMLDNPLQLGYVTFTGAWYADNLIRNFSIDGLRDLTNLSPMTEMVKYSVNELPDQNYLDLGTNFDEPLRECGRQYFARGQDQSLKICVLITDGQDLHERGCLRNNFRNDQKLTCGDDPVPIAAQLRATGIKIFAVYIGANQNNARFLFNNISSCADQPGADFDAKNCIWEADAASNQQLEEGADAIVEKLVNTVETRTYTRTDNSCLEPEWAALLLLLLPLVIAILFTVYYRCAGVRETVIRRIRKSEIPPGALPPDIPTQEFPVESHRVRSATGVSLNFENAWEHGGFVYVEDKKTQEEVATETISKFLECMCPCCTLVVYRKPTATIAAASKMSRTTAFPSYPNGQGGPTYSTQSRLTAISEGQSSTMSSIPPHYSNQTSSAYENPNGEGVTLREGEPSSSREKAKSRPLPVPKGGFARDPPPLPPRIAASKSQPLPPLSSAPARSSSVPGNKQKKAPPLPPRKKERERKDSNPYRTKAPSAWTNALKKKPKRPSQRLTGVRTDPLPSHTPPPPSPNSRSGSKKSPPRRRGPTAPSDYNLGVTPAPPVNNNLRANRRSVPGRTISPRFENDDTTESKMSSIPDRSKLKLKQKAYSTPTRGAKGRPPPPGSAALPPPPANRAPPPPPPVNVGKLLLSSSKKGSQQSLFRL